MASRFKPKKPKQPTAMVTPASSSSAPIESRLQPLQFNAFHSDGSNFLEWMNDAKTVLATEDLSNTLEDDPTGEIYNAYKSHALLLLRRYMDQALRLQYIQVEDPARLWRELNARFNHQETLFLPQAK